MGAGATGCIKRQSTHLARQILPENPPGEPTAWAVRITPVSFNHRVLMATFETAYGDGLLEKCPARLTPWARQFGDCSEVFLVMDCDPHWLLT